MHFGTRVKPNWERIFFNELKSICACTPVLHAKEFALLWYWWLKSNKRTTFKWKSTTIDGNICIKSKEYIKCIHIWNFIRIDILFGLEKYLYMKIITDRIFFSLSMITMAVNFAYCCVLLYEWQRIVERTRRKASKFDCLFHFSETNTSFAIQRWRDYYGRSYSSDEMTDE